MLLICTSISVLIVPASTSAGTVHSNFSANFTSTVFEAVRGFEPVRGALLIFSSGHDIAPTDYSGKP
jgi:hypothetical protein